MPNKHQIQKDFYKKMSEWKENYKVNTDIQNEESQNLMLRESSYEKIKKARIRVENMAFKDTSEHRALAEEADKRIEKGKIREAKAGIDSQYYFGR